MKNRDRDEPTFANINLLGPCNVDCYFCLGKDIPDYVKGFNHLNVHWSMWKNFEKFLSTCKDHGINNLYITGQNTDSLLYRYLDGLIEYLQEKKGFLVGVRTNGYLAEDKLDTLNKCKRSVGYSIHSLSPDTNYAIMGKKELPPWGKLLSYTDNARVSILVNRYNYDEVPSMINILSLYPIKYIQLRKLSTETRKKSMSKDEEVFEYLYEVTKDNFEVTHSFFGAEAFNIYGKEVLFWRTVETSINSYNYFTDGTVSDEYFIVEGYLRHREKSNERSE